MNDGEATMVVELVKYLLNNLYKGSQITVLAMYNRQISIIRRKLRMRNNYV